MSYIPILDLFTFFSIPICNYLYQNIRLFKKV